jgi:hypothetical protein
MVGRALANGQRVTVHAPDSPLRKQLTIDAPVKIGWSLADQRVIGIRPRTLVAARYSSRSGKWFLCGAGTKVCIVPTSDFGSER